MNLVLIRTKYCEEGVFGKLVSEDGHFSCVTLEHAYAVGDGTWAPKLNIGVHGCVRGIHKLGDRLVQIETFEIGDVPGHAGILFHRGNRQSDSEGCVLLGKEASSNVIVKSAEAFQEFMKIQDGLAYFTLTVQDEVT